MIRALCAVLCGLMLSVPACCGLHHHDCDHCAGQQGGEHVAPEPPFVLPGGHTGAGLVFGTADFGSTGSVLIKVQVEDRNDAHSATFTVWSGTSDATAVTPANVATLGTQVYTSGGNVPLRYWTTHLDRTYPAGAPEYWLCVQVEYVLTNGNHESKYFLNSWGPSPTPPAPLDGPHDFNGL